MTFTPKSTGAPIFGRPQSRPAVNHLSVEIASALN